MGIREFLKRFELKQSDLSRITGISCQSLKLGLQGKVKMRESTIKKINSGVQKFADDIKETEII